MSIFGKKKKEIILETPVDVYKFTPGGLYVIEVNKRNVTMQQMQELVRSASIYDIKIKVIYNTGDSLALYPIKAIPSEAPE